jgi:hypothetical protein
MVHTVVLSIIEEATKSGEGICTTQLRRAYQKKTNEFPEIGSDKEVLETLKKDGKIRFLSEPWGDYCWLVPADHKGSPSEGRADVEMVEREELFF